MIPLVSVITVNYKQAEITRQMLQSLQNVTWPNLEVIVVDNASGSKSINQVCSEFSGITLIKSVLNRGFAGGNNLGILQAKGDFILLLNNDTEVEPDFIERLVETFSLDSSIGAVSPKIKYFDNPHIIQYAGYTELNPFNLRMKAYGSKQKDEGRWDKIKETPYAHGCAFMIKRSALEKVGMMYEKYFLYYEEHDWSISIRKAGFKIMYQPKSVVYHKESISVKKNSPLKTYYMNRNRILLMRRQFSLLKQIAPTLYLLLLSIPVKTAQYILKRQKAHLQAYLKAIFWNLSHTKNSIKWIG